MAIGTALKKINARVKVLQKKHPNSKRVTLQRQAGKEYKAGKLKVKRKRKIGSSGNTRTATKASTSRNRTATSTKTITAHVKVGAVRKRRKKRTVKKRTNRAVMKVSKSVSRRVYRPKVVRVKAYKAARYRRVSGSGKSLMPLVAIAAVGVIGYLLLKPKDPVTPPQYQQTGNPARDAAANNILQYASAAGMALSAITALINSLNKQSDSSIQAANTSINNGSGIPPWL